MTSVANIPVLVISSWLAGHRHEVGCFNTYTHTDGKVSLVKITFSLKLGCLAALFLQLHEKPGRRLRTTGPRGRKREVTQAGGGRKRPRRLPKWTASGPGRGGTWPSSGTAPRGLRRHGGRGKERSVGAGRATHCILRPRNVDCGAACPARSPRSSCTRPAAARAPVGPAKPPAQSRSRTPSFFPATARTARPLPTAPAPAPAPARAPGPAPPPAPAHRSILPRGAPLGPCS